MVQFKCRITEIYLEIEKPVETKRGIYKILIQFTVNASDNEESRGQMSAHPLKSRVDDK